MNETGYSMLNRKQINLMYGSKSPYNNSKAVQRFSYLNNSIIHSLIEKDIHLSARAKNIQIRQKDQVLSPLAFAANNLNPTVGNTIVLSPIIFSTIILSPILLGPIILSPLLFVPVILTPTVLSPVSFLLIKYN